MLSDQVNAICAGKEQHYDNCPDVLIHRLGDGFGLHIKDGGISVIEINFCPWCGANLKNFA